MVPLRVGCFSWFQTALWQGPVKLGLGELTATTAASVEGHRPAQTPKDTVPSGRAASPREGPGQQSPAGRRESPVLSGPQSGILRSSHH